MTAGFTKPTTLLRNAEVGVRKLVGAPVPADPRRGFTDHMEVLSSQLMIGYKKYPAVQDYPNAGMKAAAVAATALAARVVRKVNDEFAGILMLRRKESALMQEVLAAHFHLRAGEVTDKNLKSNVVDKPLSLKGIVEKDRRWVLEKIRQKMLSLSFHLNTGVYLIDIDAKRRDIQAGAAHVYDPDDDDGTEAYVANTKTKYDAQTWRATNWKKVSNSISGFRKGEIHVSLEDLETYSTLSYARVIIHEATHKYLCTDDVAYAHDDTYPSKSLSQMLNNADSYAWAAVSLYCGELKMGTPADEPTDWEQCS
ncbi:M35 family metallopeptidase [Variovorax sp. dw_308]|uniref:M35 family metallopeptidase n=1 Tax=Variovorax sp. dw_308 TaxID=2721546 RepID=UPI001C45B8F6|nr:M35 family metallopeptidase [Variovorax sp. dw_308]